MSDTESNPRELARAVELVSASYEEAMRQHGLLPGTVIVISTAARAKLAEVLADEHAPD
ncbi:hypothetical protein [Spirillospora sp. CA-294931]|uniref:hypothetical protein n=1 Tax=Spirillospora sp. CA-294931 TaxID=3240042 RepID=UPI003D935884